MNSIHFGDTFKVVVPAKSVQEAAQEKKAELDSKKAKGGWVSDYDYKKLEENPEEAVQRDADITGDYAAQAAADLAGLTIVTDQFIPKAEKKPGMTQEKTVYLVSNGPMGNDLDTYDTINRLGSLVSTAKAEQKAVPEDLTDYLSELTSILKERLRHAVQLPLLSYTATR